MLQETFCYGDVLLRRRFVWRRFEWRRFVCAPEDRKGAEAEAAGGSLQQSRSLRAVRALLGTRTNTVLQCHSVEKNVKMEYFRAKK
jgi:hypothetical protein